MIKKRILLVSLYIFFLISSNIYSQQLFWAEPEVLQQRNVRFPQAQSGGGLVVVMWQEYDGNNIYLSYKSSRDLFTWKENLRFKGPYHYEGKEVPVFSFAMDNNACIYIAVANSEDRVLLMYSDDEGNTFTDKTVYSNVTIVSPRLFLKDSGGLLLFVSNDLQDALSIYYLGFGKSFFTGYGSSLNLSPFIREQPRVLNFLPHHTSFKGKEYVVYQSQNVGLGEPYQLYLKISDSNSNFNINDIPVSLTSNSEEVDGTLQSYSRFDNQRPFITGSGENLCVVWERSYSGRQQQIYLAEIDRYGNLIEDSNNISPYYTRVTDGNYTCMYPKAFNFRGSLYLLWFDNRRGVNHIIMSQRDGEIWREKDISRDISGDSIYAWFIQEGGILSIFWENQYRGTSKLISVSPDQFVQKPQITPVNFIAEKPNKSDEVRIRWNVPSDYSGISGFSYVWSQDPTEQASKNIMVRSSVTSVTTMAVMDGNWYFHLRAMDNAENWSETATLKYIKDTKPPGTAHFSGLDWDDDGFLSSNTFRLKWFPATDNNEVSGYTYSLKQVTASSFDSNMPENELFKQLYDKNFNLDKRLADKINITVPERILTGNTEMSYVNLDNGFWVFGIAAVDVAGNIGEVEKLFFRLNKYIPVTVISNIYADNDGLGNIILNIRGRGFTEEGTIHTIFLDRDGKEPFDYTFLLKENEFDVESDRYIGNLSISSIDDGEYLLGMIHPKRGIKLSNEIIYLESPGTIKIGDYSYKYSPEFSFIEKSRFSFSINIIFIAAIIVLLGIALIFSFRKIIILETERREFKIEVMNIIHGKFTQKQKENKMKKLKIKGFGLRFKYTMLIAVLVVIIVLMISIPLSFIMIQTQTTALAQGLEQNARVLLGSLSTGSEDFLLDRRTQELNVLTNQIIIMPEAQYAIITGISSLVGDFIPGENKEYVWAVSDEDALEGMIEGEFIAGVSEITDIVSAHVQELSEQVNTEAREQVSSDVKELEKLNAEVLPLIGSTKPEDQVRVLEISQATANLENRIDLALSRIASQIRSIPEFNYNDLKEEYIFYMPIVYRKTGEDIYYRGMVRLDISAVEILKEIRDSTNLLILTISVIALIAVGLGTLGALVLASITISPIKKLVAGVEKIRDTEDKEELKDHSINIKQQDEIRILADTVNQMTQGLVKAAAASKELTVGKEVQKMFIPLKTDSKGAKLTTGGEKNKNVEIFGYYEGAKGVSGDYFDYIKLSEQYYAFIKCDIAGKGVPAALIMVEVATLFLAHFRNWTLKKPGLKIDDLVYTINDMLEERGFKGRFAALTIVIIDIVKGSCYFCNAGDNIIHIYDSKQKKMVTDELPKSPAAGVFPSDLVEMQSGFSQEMKKLNKGDILFLFTDGLDEAQRLFRDTNFKPITCTEKNLSDGESHGGTHLKGSEFEELSVERLHAIINTVFNRGMYKLEKYHNPNPDVEIDFDFTHCEPTVENAVLAVIAVERMFRIFKHPDANQNDVIFVDKRIDQFLKEHLVQYNLFFANPLETSEESNYSKFSHLKEDSQYDDLTIIGIKKE